MITHVVIIDKKPGQSRIKKKIKAKLKIKHTTKHLFYAKICLFWGILLFLQSTGVKRMINTILIKYKTIAEIGFSRITLCCIDSIVEINTLYEIILHDTLLHACAPPASIFIGVKVKINSMDRIGAPRKEPKMIRLL